MYKQNLFILLLSLLAGCGIAAPAQAPTPTPLPPAPALERPIYTVRRGPVERALALTGRVTPVDLERLSFQVAGRVAQVNVRRGDAVRAGDILAEIIHTEALESLSRAEARVAQAERELELARRHRERAITQARIDVGEAGRGLEADRAELAAQVADAELALRRAEQDLALLTDDGPESLIGEAERALDKAREQARLTAAAASEAKTHAEHALIAAADALVAAQQAYSDAFWDLDWVTKHNTHPREKIANPANGKEEHRPLQPGERTAFERAYQQAERELHAAERAIPLAERAVELARVAEIRAVSEGERTVAEAQNALDLLRTGQGSVAIVQARRRVEDARLALEAARRATVGSAAAALERARLGLSAAEQDALNAELTNLDAARLDLETARRRVDEGRVIAPRDGIVVALAIGPGDLIEPYEPIVELADPARLEIAAELSTDQMRELTEGQAAEIRLVSRPDQALPARIRHLPAPYGSGGSGAVAEQDRTTRFSLEAGISADLSMGAVARIHVVVERKDNALWLPPEAIRSFEGRRFVVVREGRRERRTPIRTGIETAERVEILEGLAEGEAVVGQ